MVGLFARLVRAFFVGVHVQPVHSEMFGGTRLDYYATWVEITVPGYEPFQAVAEDNAEYTARAAALGFASPDAMNFEHDRAHAYLAERLGLKVSPALLGVAAKYGPNEVTDAEEQFVLAFHRYKNLLIKHGFLGDDNANRTQT